MAGSAVCRCMGHARSSSPTANTFHQTIGNVIHRPRHPIHTPTATISCSGFRSTSRTFGEVASCVETNTRNAVRHPTSPRTPNHTEYIHLTILLRRSCTMAINIISKERRLNMKRGVTYHGVGGSEAFSPPSKRIRVRATSGAPSSKCAPSTFSIISMGTNISARPGIPASRPLPRARSMPNWYHG